jgi:membrane-bound lytic murein transglycosylase F
MKGFIAKNTFLPCLIFVFILSSCVRKLPLAYEDPNLDNGSNESTEIILRDFPTIKQEGKIRLLTRYNSNSYFLQRGHPRGFEFELVEAFAKENKLEVDVIILRADDDPYEMLKIGLGDIYAANLSINDERRGQTTFTAPYNVVDQILAINTDYNLADDLEGLGPITISVKKSTSYFSTLKKLKEQNAAFTLEEVTEEWDTEGLLQAVSRGEIMATVADENILQAARSYLPNLEAGPSIAKSDTIAWAIRSNVPILKSKVNTFLAKHFRISKTTGEPLRSAFLNILSKKYYTDGSEVAKNIRPVRNVLQRGQLSVYDEIIKKVSDEHGVDWKLVASLIAQESQFDPYAESWMGARGLMQIMPEVVSSDSLNLFDPYVNVKEGINLLNQHLRHYSYLDSTNQWALALATYNAGMGHVADARRIVIDMNRDPNEWENVSDALLKLMRHQHYQHARYGFCRGIETVKYVTEVMNRYSTYSAILAIAQSGEYKQPFNGSSSN